MARWGEGFATTGLRK